jgi:hypothetical protein
MNEAETRAELIDPKLKACGWGVVEGTKVLLSKQPIAGQLDALRVETQKLEAVNEKKIDDSEELKKSILELALSPVEGKAFAGELPSPEGSAFANDGHSPSDKKRKSITSPEGA